MPNTNAWGCYLYIHIVLYSVCVSIFVWKKDEEEWQSEDEWEERVIELTMFWQCVCVYVSGGVIIQWRRFFLLLGGGPDERPFLFLLADEVSSASS